MSEGTSVDRRNFYQGEVANQLRHGYGVYVYANKFFRYEGDWVKGKKHGHGKLIMADGSYYEGEFKEGEIDGHGFRKWQHTGNCYSGEFCKGEMQGHGVMNYVDGKQYQGEFYKNQRHGTGILKGPGNEIYEGSWYKNKKHGQGVQTYDNGDEYEGEWVEGTRQGHGLLSFFDGSVYEGQWWADMFNGQGAISHISGAVYEGLWINNLPATQATEIVVDISNTQTPVEVAQGKRFSIQFRLVNAEQVTVTEEHGREFKISAGYKFTPLPKSSPSQSILELLEDLEAKPIPTPFGYDVLPYPIVECLKELDDAEDILVRRKMRQSPLTSRVFASDVIHESTEDSKSSLKPEGSQADHTDEADAVSSSYSGSKQDTSDLDVDGEDEASLTTSRLPPPGVQRSSPEGFFEFSDLLLPSAPANYRPFLLEDEVLSTHSSTATGSTASMRRGPRVASVSEKKRSRGSRTTSAASSSSTSLADAKTSKGGKMKGEDEKGAKTGDYVVIVEEVTNPPFLGTLLPPAFVLVKVTASTPRKVVTKKAGGKKN